MPLVGIQGNNRCGCELGQCILTVHVAARVYLLHDGADDLMVAGEQVTEVMAEYNMQLSEDAKDDADFQPNPNRVPLAVLFVNMPEFDVNLLFDEVIA